MFATFAFSLVLLGLSGLLIDSHRRGWRSARQDEALSDRDRRFARAQYRRRLQASGIIGVLGIAIGIGPLVPRRPGPLLFYVTTLAGACLCIVVLAALDMWATRQRYRQMQVEHLTAQLQLARELRTTGESSDAEA